MSRHAWENWILSDAHRDVLRGSKERLKIAWRVDSEDQNRYPINTEYVLAQVKAALSPAKTQKNRKNLLVPPKLPRTLAELVPEKSVRAIWELNHQLSFEGAIMEAARIDYDNPERSEKTFKAILRAIEIAYYSRQWGWEVLPKPKINILHRGLDDIAKAAGLEAQTEAGFAEFLDDLCPCGIKDHREAIRKLGARAPHIRRPKR